MRLAATRLAATLVLALIAAPAFSKLPEPSEEDKAKAAAIAARSAWADKVGLYQTCLAEDRVAAAYRKSPQASLKTVSSTPATPCVDPGPFEATFTPAANKPLEASATHSPPGQAVSPPSTNATAAEIAGGVKKKSPN
jgi:hypothetical protein